MKIYYYVIAVTCSVFLQDIYETQCGYKFSFFKILYGYGKKETMENKLNKRLSHHFSRKLTIGSFS